MNNDPDQQPESSPISRSAVDEIKRLHEQIEAIPRSQDVIDLAVRVGELLAKAKNRIEGNPQN